MKRIFICILCVLLCVTVCGCQKENKESQNSSVVINLASDNTVNGYREESFSKAENTVSISSNSASVNSATQNTVSSNYCANKNSKVFHKADCSSVKTMKEENKYLSSNRSALVNEGYTPCKRCNP